MINQQQIFKYLLALILGAMLTFAFAPFYVSVFGFIIPAFLLWLFDRATPRQAFLLGLIFGLGFFTCATSWIFISIYFYGGANIVIAILLIAVFIAVMATYMALVGWLLSRFFSRANLSKYLLAFPALWVTMEWLRAHIGTGFPWVLLGYSQTLLPLSGFAKLGSVYLVSFMTIFTGGGLYALFVFRRQRMSAAMLITAMLSVLLIGHLLQRHAFTHVAGPAKNVTFIQADIPPSIKWDQAQMKMILQKYLTLANKNWQPGLMLWPENALPVIAMYIPRYLSLLNHLAKIHHVALLAGMPLYGANSGNVYNGAAVLGEGSGTYEKRHLIPFGEYLPFSTLFNPFLNLLNMPMSSFSKGPDAQMLPLMQDLKVAVYICYESTYPEEIHDTFNGAPVIVTITDDSWFGHSLGAVQHLQMEQMRAIETGRFILRSTNTGITSIINPEGQIIRVAPPFQTVVLVGQFSPMQGDTPWARLGIWPWLVLMLLLLGWAYRCQRPKRL